MNGLIDIHCNHEPWHVSLLGSDLIIRMNNSVWRSKMCEITWGGSPGQSVTRGPRDTVPWDDSSTGGHSRNLQSLNCTALHWHKGWRQRERETQREREVMYLILYPYMLLLLYFLERTLVTCLDFGGGYRPLDVSKDGIDGNGVLGGLVEALDHVEVKGVPKVYVFYVAI